MADEALPPPPANGAAEEKPATGDAAGEDRSRDRDRRRSRSRDRDRRRDDRRDRDRDRDRDRRRRSRSRDRDRRRRSRSRSRDRRRRSRSRSASPEDEATREARRQQEEIDDLTKDQRTVFVSQLVMKADERKCRKYFEKVGKVKQVIMIRDKYTNRHKGFAYVEMKDLESIPLVLMLNGIAPDFQKFPILIKASEAEKNFLAKQEEGGEGEVAGKPKGPKEKKPDKLYVGNLHVHITESDLEQVFMPFGTVENVSVVRDEMGGSKGYGFVKFERVEDAKTALEKLTSIGLELMGKAIKVSHTNDTMGMVAPKPAATAVTDSLDENGQKTSGMPMNSQTRAALMAKLGANAGIAPPPMPGMPAAAPGALPPGMGMPMAGGIEAAKAMAAQALPGMVPPAVAAAAPGGVPPGPTVTGQPSFCFMIRNMFDPATETEPGWDQDIKEDVEGECSKFGSVLHCFVESRQPGGLVYLLFSTTPMAQQAAQSLGGRWFAGRMITCEFLNPDRYAAQFPEAAQGVATAQASMANMGGY